MLPEMPKKIELNDVTERWLSIFTEDALQAGLSGSSSHITEKVYEELSEANIIERVPGNDGDYGHHGKVKFTEQFISDLTRRMNLYGLIRSLIHEGMFPCSEESAASKLKEWDGENWVNIT